MTAGADRNGDEGWFLSRGMPAALTARARWRHVFARSAPALLFGWLVSRLSSRRVQTGVAVTAVSSQRLP
jgi:hypothetical protein